MFRNTSSKVFIGLVITVLVLVLIEHLTVRNESFFTYFGHLQGNVTDSLNRNKNPAASWIPQPKPVPNVRKRSNNDTFVDVMETRKVHLLHRNIIKTALESPMAATSRNMLDRYSEYVKIKRVADFKELVDRRFCVVEPEVDSKTATVTAGTELRVRIHQYNGYNQSLAQGGDLLNIWLRSTDGKSSVAGYVVDHMNGTYTGHVMAFWAGDVSVKVTVTNTKEAIGLYTNHVNDYGAYQFINATFSEGKRNEMTKCAPKTSDWLNTSYGGICNLTHENYNLSFYCGKPKSVSCEKWVKFGWDVPVNYDGYTRKILSYKDVLLKQFKVTIAPSAKGDLDYPVPETPCYVFPRALTWNSTVPSGFLHRGEYHNLICRPTVKKSREGYLVCLKDKPITIIGDSTTRHWFLRLSNFLNIKYTESFTTNNAWQKLAHAYNTTLGFDMDWQPHELPFYGSPGSDRKTMKTVAYRLNKIPGNSTAIVIIHWYAHIALCCDHQVFRTHVRHAKPAIVRLLTRSPDVKIFIKGPHHLTMPQDRKPFAYIGRFVEQILLEEFSDLLHKIIYLDQWDISVATENFHIHPEPLLNDISLKNMINFAC